MADIYLSSVDGDDGDDGSTWALAKATLAAALTAAGAGGTVYVDNAHAETQASAMTLTSPGTAASPVRVLCVDRTGNPEPPTALATTATVSTTGNSAMTFAGFAFVYGVTFSVGSGNNGLAFANFTSISPWYWIIESGSIQLGSIHGGVRIFVGANSVGSDDCGLELVNSTLKFGNAAEGVVLRCPMLWRNSAALAAGGTTPTTLFLSPAGAAPYGRLRASGVDFSDFGSGNNLVQVGVDFNRYDFENCKLGSSVSVATGTFAGQGGTKIRVVNCDSADTSYRYHKQDYQGTITQETTIVRTGGASDGTTPVSRKMESTANAHIFAPLESDPVVFWNETVGSSVTVTVETVTDNVTLTDKEAWVEVEYLGTSGFPLALFADDRASNNNAHLGSGTNQTTSSETWTTTGLTTPVKQKLSVTFTPQEKGLIRARVMLAKASTTMYFDPLILASSGRQYMIGVEGMVNEAPQAGGASTAVLPAVLSYGAQGVGIA